MNDIFLKSNTPLRLRPYEILVTSASSGIIEFLPNTSSIDGIKKNYDQNLYAFYKNSFKHLFLEAQKKFTCSLAAYSIVCYLL